MPATSLTGRTSAPRSKTYQIKPLLRHEFRASEPLVDFVGFKDDKECAEYPPVGLPSDCHDARSQWRRNRRNSDLQACRSGTYCTYGGWRGPSIGVWICAQPCSAGVWAGSRPLYRHPVRDLAGYQFDRLPDVSQSA